LDEVAAHCPTCGAEYRLGFDTCADDGTALVPGPAPADGADAEPSPPPSAPAAEVRWAVVASFAREEEARLLAGRLGTEGIEARVYPEFQGGYYGESVHVPVRVLVPEHRVLEARAVIEELERA